MDASKNRGVYPPKWMVYKMENPMNKWMIWEKPLFLGNTQISFFGVANFRISIFEFYRFQNDKIDHMIFKYIYIYFLKQTCTREAAANCCKSFS